MGSTSASIWVQTDRSGLLPYTQMIRADKKKWAKPEMQVLTGRLDPKAEQMTHCNNSRPPPTPSNCAKKALTQEEQKNMRTQFNSLPGVELKNTKCETTAQPLPSSRLTKSQREWLIGRMMPYLWAFSLPDSNLIMRKTWNKSQRRGIPPTA